MPLGARQVTDNIEIVVKGKHETLDSDNLHKPSKICWGEKNTCSL